MLEIMIKDLQEVVDTLMAAMDRILLVMNSRMDNFEARLIPLEQKVSNIETVLLDIRDDMDAALTSIDTHAVQLIDHRKRISRLEKRFA